MFDDVSGRSEGLDLPIGIVVAVAFVISAAAGFATGSLTASAAAPATESGPASMDAVLPDSLGSESETLAEGQAPSGGATTGSGVEILSWVDTDDSVFFVTIDDGLVTSPEVREVIDRYQIPVTAFLTEYTVRDATEYFTAVTAYGGSVQNHTMVHGALDDTATDVEWEICETQNRFEQQFGYRPWMLRPPYGAGAEDPDVLRYAEQCGIRAIVMWNVVVGNDNTVEYWKPPLRSGDIVLLHWGDNLAQGLETLMQLGEAQGLRPAPLEDYL